MTIKTSLGLPKNSNAKAPTTGAIIGAIPIIAMTLERGLAESVFVVSLIMALDIIVPTLPPMPWMNLAIINVERS